MKIVEIVCKWQYTEITRICPKTKYEEVFFYQNRR